MTPSVYKFCLYVIHIIFFAYMQNMNYNYYDTEIVPLNTLKMSALIPCEVEKTLSANFVPSP
jgi:hypothetical protein